MPSNWWPISEARSMIGHDQGTALITWLHDTVAQPHRLLGRPGPMCPFLPATLRRGLLFATVINKEEPAEQVLEVEATRFLKVAPVPPDPASVNKSLLALFPDEITGLPEVVKKVKAMLISRGLTCGEFYPTNSDRSVRSDQVLVARSPVPLIALRYLTPHDRLFLAAHPEYGPLLEKWSFEHG